MARVVTLLAYNRYNLFTPAFDTHYRGLEVVVDRDHDDYREICDAIASINDPDVVHMGTDIERITQLLSDGTVHVRAFEHTPAHLESPGEEEEVTE